MSKKGYASAGKIVKTSSFGERNQGGENIPTKLSKQEKWLKMREEQIRKKRNW